MRPNLATFLEYVNILSRKLRPALASATSFIVFFDEIRQMQRARQPRRPRADDQHIRFKLFTFNGHGFAFIVAKWP